MYVGTKEPLIHQSLSIIQLVSGKFFSWKDKPFCGNCGTKTEAIGPVQPTAEDRRWHAGIVEGYKCPKCRKHERYPRYNHPGKLLGKENMIKANFPVFS